MKAVIFGANGQDGFYLSEILNRQNIQVIGTSRKSGDVIGDVADWNFVENLLKTEKPDYVFHLAANSTTRHDALFENHQTISTGTLNILETVYKHKLRSKIFLSGSAVQFKNSGEPIDENTPFAAISPYAVSRIQSIYAGRYYRSLGLEVYAGYFFNHDSPLRCEQHVNRKIVDAAKRIQAGDTEKFELGDITVKKEFNFAGDMMEAVWRLVDQNEVFEAVLGSGKVYSIEYWLELCFAQIGKDWRDYVVIKNDFKSEYKVLQSNPALIESLGLPPRVEIEELAAMMME